MDAGMFLLHCGIYCGLFTVALAAIGIKNPRMMLQDYPPEIIAAVPPKSKQEKRQGVVYAIPFLTVFIGYPAWVGSYYGYDGSFADIFKIVWSLMLVANLYDLVILDWLVICTITPRFVVLKGTEGNKGYKNYLFHFKGFLKGILITGVVALIISGLLLL